MWKSLDDPDITLAFQQHPAGTANAHMVPLLEAVVRANPNSELFAVTSLWSLGFTMARNHEEAAYRPSVAVRPDGPDQFCVEFRRMGSSAAERVESCQASALHSTVMRMLGDLMHRDGCPLAGHTARRG